MLIQTSEAAGLKVQKFGNKTHVPTLEPVPRPKGKGSAHPDPFETRHMNRNPVTTKQRDVTSGGFTQLGQFQRAVPGMCCWVGGDFWGETPRVWLFLSSKHNLRMSEARGSRSASGELAPAPSQPIPNAPGDDRDRKAFEKHHGIEKRNKKSSEIIFQLKKNTGQSRKTVRTL